LHVHVDVVFERLMHLFRTLLAQTRPVCQLATKLQLSPSCGQRVDSELRWSREPRRAQRAKVT
jgi:hypothetical protein